MRAKDEKNDDEKLLSIDYVYIEKKVYTISAYSN
jgi:hypothetical protein